MTREEKIRYLQQRNERHAIYGKQRDAVALRNKMLIEDWGKLAALPHYLISIEDRMNLLGNFYHLTGKRIRAIVREDRERKKMASRQTPAFS